MSYISNLNKKNLRLKNISYMSPHSNVSNIFAESQRMITSSNAVNFQQNTNIELQKNQLLNDVFKSYSTNRPIHSNHQYKKPNIHLNYVSNGPLLTNPNSKNYYKKTSTSPSNSSMYYTYMNNFPINNKNGNYQNYYINSNYKNILKYSTQISTKNVRNKRNQSLTNNNSLNNFNITQSKENNLLLSTNVINNTQIQSQIQKYNTNTDMINKTKNNNNVNNKIHHQQNFSSDFLNNFTPLSASTSTNNIGKFYNEIYKRINYTKNNNKINSHLNSGLNTSKKNNYVNYQNDQNVFNTTKESTIGKKIAKGSLNTNSCYSSEFEFSSTKNVESPEELHFYFIHVIQNGKEIENKFDILNSIVSN